MANDPAAPKGQLGGDLLIRKTGGKGNYFDKILPHLRHAQNNSLCEVYIYI